MRMDRIAKEDCQHTVAEGLCSSESDHRSGQSPRSQQFCQSAAMAGSNQIVPNKNGKEEKLTSFAQRIGAEKWRLAIGNRTERGQGSEAS